MRLSTRTRAKCLSKRKWLEWECRPRAGVSAVLSTEGFCSSMPPSTAPGFRIRSWSVLLRHLHYEGDVPGPQCACVRRLVTRAGATYSPRRSCRKTSAGTMTWADLLQACRRSWIRARPPPPLPPRGPPGAPIHGSSTRSLHGSKYLLPRRLLI